METTTIITRPNLTMPGTMTKTSTVNQQQNPLLRQQALPPFAQISTEHVVPAVQQVLKEGKEALNSVLDSCTPPTWENLVAPLEALDDRIHQAWSPVSHLHGVVDSEALREAYKTSLPLLSEFNTELTQNEDLYRAFQALAESTEYPLLDTAQRRVIDNSLRDFRLGGVALSPEHKTRFKAIVRRLSELSTRFEEQVLDATEAWSKHINDSEQLRGLPDSTLTQAREKAKAKDLDGWLLGLDAPCYIAIVTYAENSDLRRELYTAYSTRASDQGPHAGQWDNGPVLDEILALRHELSGLLDFGNYGEYSLATKMADSAGEVLGFLQDLATRALPIARQELAELEAFATTEFDCTELAPWDIAYCSEKLRQHRYAFSQEDLRPYFPLPRVLDGLFGILQRLFGIQLEIREGVENWHPDVSCYRVLDAGGELRGSCYIDLYARAGKRNGAWMDECRQRRRTGAGIENPVAFVNCNFAPPSGGKPAGLTHDDVLTLFHEFGHALHHLLTRVEYASVSGINGVEWDAVELPSQLLENWCWEREALSLISAHVDTGEILPEALYEKLLGAKNFHSALQMVRQLEFSLFDFRLHLEYQAGSRTDQVQAMLDTVRAEVAVIQPPSWNRFAHSFGHIFAGGYGAGYYSYKWAEVLSSDAFSRFEEQGVFDPSTGRRFLQAVLEQGGTRGAMELFIEFRGRKPKIDALLRHSGIAA